MKKLIEKIKEKLRSKKPAKRQVVSPHRHWKILLFSFFAVILLLIILSIYLLYKIKNDEIVRSSPAVATPKNLVDQKKLDAVMKSFDQKAQKEAGIAAHLETYRDPSL